MLGLWKAIITYDSARAQFSTWAVYHISSQMTRCLRSARRVPRHLSLDYMVANEVGRHKRDFANLVPAFDDHTAVEIRDWLVRIDVNERTAVIMYLQGYKQREIAADLGTHQVEVSRMLRRAVKRYIEA
ncbi:MAG: sigma-70 family RNA polymerase sigma factor [Alicyclobacillus macrosporangiidus]|nr:sigma-70 family RNA polymerase sigma factor [Alicyclobacillus macrosporangiidus]